MTYTIFDHAQHGHCEPRQQRPRLQMQTMGLPVRKKKLKPRMRRKSKWYSNLGLRK